MSFFRFSGFVELSFEGFQLLFCLSAVATGVSQVEFLDAEDTIHAETRGFPKSGRNRVSSQHPKSILAIGLLIHQEYRRLLSVVKSGRNRVGIVAIARIGSTQTRCTPRFGQIGSKSGRSDAFDAMLNRPDLLNSEHFVYHTHEKSVLTVQII